MIKPTVGRVILFYPNRKFTDGDKPIPAFICKIWNDNLINIGGFDSNGHPFKQEQVFLSQTEGDVPAEQSSYAAWMPYQKAVAAGEVLPTLHA